MAMASEANKNNPEKIGLSPENFDLSKNSQEKLSSAENISLKNEKDLEKLDKQNELNKLELDVQDGSELKVKAGQAISFHKRRAMEIDKILADGLHETFLNLSPKKQQEFKLEGEKTTVKINLLLDKTKIKVDKIIDLIRKWLKIIPGINQFFLEQEAKIKADKIINIKDKV